MGIRFQCPGCQRNLNVKSYLAGRRGICPKCKTRLTIPAQSNSVPTGSKQAEGAVHASVPSRSAETAQPKQSADQLPIGKTPIDCVAGVNRSTNATKKDALQQVDDVFENALSQFAGPTAHSPVPNPAPPSVSAPGTVSQSVGDQADSLSQINSPSRSASDQPKASLSQRELKLNSRRPAPDWDDAHSQEINDDKVRQLNSRPANSAAAESSDESTAHGSASVDPVAEATDTSAATGKAANRSGSTPSQGDVRPFEDLPFEDLDPSSFVLDRPESKQVDKPKGYFDWIAESPQSVWYVRHRNGSQYGPAAGPQMRTWVEEGRVPEGCHVWREGWANWRTAVDVFPQIRQTSIPTLNSHQPTTGSEKLDRSTSSDSPEATIETEHVRSTNRWLFPALLMFLAVVASIVGAGIYQFIYNQNEPDSNSFKGRNGEIVDPFADNNPEAIE